MVAILLSDKELERILSAIEHCADGWDVRRAIRNARSVGVKGFLELREVALGTPQARWLENALDTYMFRAKAQPRERRNLLVESTARRLIERLRATWRPPSPRSDPWMNRAS
jgi:hypothetical protein